jgi:hypothetical protein
LLFFPGTKQELPRSPQRVGVNYLLKRWEAFERFLEASPAELESLLPDRWIQEHPEARMRQRLLESHAAAERKRRRRAQRRAAILTG